MTKTKRKKQVTAKQIQEDIDFYLALKAMPPEKLGPLAESLKMLDAIYAEMMASREEVARAEAALAASAKASHDSLIALVDDRIAELLSGRPPLFPDDKEPETAEDSGAEAPRVLH